MENPEKKYTIKDIAELAGVSIGTIDRVIHNRGEVSAKTREKILKITKKLDYKPDVLASVLASRKNYRFAVLMPEADHESSFWKIPGIGIEKASIEIGHYGLMLKKYLFSITDKNSFLEKARKAIEDNFDGLLIAPSFKNEASEIIQVCTEKKIPFALFNSSIDTSDQICYVGQDAMQSGHVAAKLIDCGVEKGSSVLIVSILSFLRNNKHILDRKKGFIDYFELKKERKINLIPVDIESLEIGDVYDALRKEFSLRPDIKGIFVTNSRVFHIARFIEMEKLNHIKLIGYDLTSENINYLEKDIISFLINQKPIEQAYRAIMALFTKIVLKKEVPKEILLPIDIVTKENLKYYEEY